MFNLYKKSCYGLTEIKDNSIQAVVTDPPYGIGISNNPVRQQYSKKNWDSEIPEKNLIL